MEPRASKDVTAAFEWTDRDACEWWTRAEIDRHGGVAFNEGDTAMSKTHCVERIRQEMLEKRMSMQC